MNLVPRPVRGYRREWWTGDVLAGLTLAAVAIPEVMGYTSIIHTPVVTGLYTILLPTVLFALIGSSRLLVVGADSATAAVVAAGLTGLAVAGVTPGSPEWLAWCSMIALVCGGLLLLARLLRLGFLGDFLSSSVLIGFLTGVGIQVLTGQVPALLGIDGTTGSWFAEQWGVLTGLPRTSLTTLAVGGGTLALILGFRRFAPRMPGAIVAVTLAIVAASLLDLGSHGVGLVGTVSGGLPRLGLPRGVTWAEVPTVLGIAVSCAVLVLAQSAATSRSFALRHGRKVDIDQDLLGLSVANLAAGLSGTFVVNGSPTKTEILDKQKGRTQVANLTMSAVVLLVLLVATGVLALMPRAALSAIVFLIGVGLIDLRGLRNLWARRRSEFVIACTTAAAVVGIGVEQGILLAVVLSVLELVRRQYHPKNFVVSVDEGGQPVYRPAAPGVQSLPGLVVFRYDADLFYANAHRFADDVEGVVQQAPDPVRLLVLDCSSIVDADYSASLALDGLIDFVHAHEAHFGITRADPALLASLATYGLLDKFGRDHVFGNLSDVFTAYRKDPSRYRGPAGHR